MVEQQSKRFGFLLIGLAALFIVIWGIRSLAYILNPILLATVITITILPLPQRLMQRGLPGWLSLVLTILVVVALLGGVIFLTAISIGRLVADAPAMTAGLPVATPTGTAVVDEINATLTTDRVTALLGALAVVIGRGIFLVIMVLLIFAFMLSTAISLPSLSRLGLGFDPGGLHRITQLTNDVRRYMGIMTGINFVVGVGNALLLWIMGVPYAALWGVLAWVMGFIPAVGFWVALIPPVILAYISHDLQTALIVFVGYVLINGSVQNIIQPRMMGRELRISPVVVFLSLFIWGWLLGGVGAILAVPLTLFIISTLEAFDNTRWLAIFMRLSPERKEGERQEAVARIRGFGREIRNVLTGPGHSAA